MTKSFCYSFLFVLLFFVSTVCSICGAKNIDDYSRKVQKRKKAKIRLVSQDEAETGESAWEWNGKVFLSGRYFPREDTPFLAVEKKESWNLAVTAAPEIKYSHSKLTFKLAPFARFDAVDSERSDFDFRQAYASYSLKKTDIKIGFDVENWSVLEFGRVVNIINQQDIKESLFLDSYLGQLMFSVQSHQRFGSFHLYLMPTFRPMFFFPPESRLSFGPSFEEVSADPLLGSRSDSHLDVLLRYSHSFGPVDLGAYGFYGTSRTPDLELSSQGGSALGSALPFFLQSYPTVTQFGLDLQASVGGFLQKIEATFRVWDDKEQVNLGVGAEYSFSSIFGSSMDLGLFSEFYYSNLENKQSGSRAGVTVFAPLQRDIYGGVRLSYVGQTTLSLVLAVSRDLQHQTDSLALKGEYKFASNWGFGIEGWGLTRVSAKDALLFPFRHDRFLSMTADYYF